MKLSSDQRRYGHLMATKRKELTVFSDAITGDLLMNKRITPHPHGQLQSNVASHKAMGWELERRRKLVEVVGH